MGSLAQGGSNLHPKSARTQSKKNLNLFLQGNPLSKLFFISKCKITSSICYMHPLGDIQLIWMRNEIDEGQEKNTEWKIIFEFLDKIRTFLQLLLKPRLPAKFSGKIRHNIQVPWHSWLNSIFKRLYTLKSHHLMPSFFSEIVEIFYLNPNPTSIQEFHETRVVGKLIFLISFQLFEGLMPILFCFNVVSKYCLFELFVAT